MFKLSSQGEIALQIILFIKQKKTPLTLEEVAKGIGTSEAFVRKIANRLRKNNILESTRWRSGGISLMAGTYSLFDILSASGERLDITACKSLACSKKKDQCELALLLKPIETQIMFSLRHSIISVRA